jgi:hypothetical protein
MDANSPFCSPLIPSLKNRARKKTDGLFLLTRGGKGSEFGAILQYAIEKGGRELHERGTYVRLMRLGRGSIDQQKNGQPGRERHTDANSQVRQRNAHRLSSETLRML